MPPVHFRQLPLWVRIAAALTLMNSWVLFAEFVIDRYGVDKYLPFYRYGDFCVWDIAVLASVIALFVTSSLTGRKSE